MVEAAPASGAASTESRAEIRARIKSKFVEMFGTMDQHELKINEDNNNVQVRQSWDESVNTMLAFGEMKVIEGLTPDDFRTYFEQWDTLAVDSNKTIQSCEKIGTDDGVDTLKIIAKTPWPLSNRIMFSTRYLEFDVDGGHMMLFSGDANQRYIDDTNIFSAKERKDLVIAHVYMSGWWVKPVKDGDGNTVGTNMLYLS